MPNFNSQGLEAQFEAHLESLWDEFKWRHAAHQAASIPLEVLRKQSFQLFLVECVQASFDSDAPKWTQRTMAIVSRLPALNV